MRRTPGRPDETARLAMSAYDLPRAEMALESPDVSN